ncbi:hypothetical protein FOCG_18002 [Fusarium oxysporum f. sp. radicis-lycopersici 26381]|nr:hypothetical protein FOCG_18002 [Fusarium oxysporum f. sp. radicis-lycopersici 26381]
MKIRIMGTKKQDSATVRRRLLQANRTRDCRNRQKERKFTTTANHQGEPLPVTAKPVAENGLSELENNSLPDTEEFEDNDVSARDIFTNLSVGSKQSENEIQYHAEEHEPSFSS